MEFGLAAGLRIVLMGEWKRNGGLRETEGREGTSVVRRNGRLPLYCIGNFGAFASSTPQNMDPSKDDSPKHNPPSAAILPPSLSRARDNYEKARSASRELQKAFDDLSRKVEPDLDPDEEQHDVRWRGAESVHIYTCTHAYTL